MAITKRFTSLHARLVEDKANDYAKEAGELAVKAAYSNQDAEMALTLLNDTPQHIRKAFASWLRGYGVIVNLPAPGTAAYTIGKTVDGVLKLVDGKQSKVFEIFAKGETKDVLVQEIKVRAEKKPPKFKGSDRVQKEIERLIARLKKEDADAAAFLNDVWATKVEAAIKEFTSEPLRRVA